jgi:hypothetical protein
VHTLLAIGRVLSVVVVIVIIVVSIVTVVVVTSYAGGTVTETEDVAIGGWQIGLYVVSGTCTFGPSESINISTFTAIQSVNGFGLHTETITVTLNGGGVASSITTTTLTNTTISQASNCT